MNDPTNSGSDLKLELFRHTLATLAYRGGKTLRNVPAGFEGFQAGGGTRTPGNILAHIGDLLDWGLSMANGERRTEVAGFESTALGEGSRALFRCAEKVRRLPGLDADLAGASRKIISRTRCRRPYPCRTNRHSTPHGRVAVKGENYFKAEIQMGRVGADQSVPKLEF